MATIDLKLKTYDELQFEIMNLTTKNYLQQQELERYKNRIDKVMKYIKNTRYKEKLTVGGLSPYEVDCLLEKLKGE